MSVGVYTNIMREVALRINAGYTALGLKHLQIMSKPEALQQDAMPYIQILPGSIEESYTGSGQRGTKEATLSMTLYCLYPAANRDGDNSFYEHTYITDDATNHITDDAGFLLATNYDGFSMWLEKLLDYINTDLTGVMNPQFTDSTQSMAISVNNITKNESTLSAEITITVETGHFGINNRQQI